MARAATSPIFDPVSDNASWQTAWQRVMGANAVVRTSPRWDGMVKHLGYVSVDATPKVKDALAAAITTDRELVSKSQEVLREARVVPDYTLTPRTLAHLKLARAIASHFTGVAGIHASVIPPASDQVRTAGLYDRGTQEIMLHLETLEHARSTVDAMVHELGHHVANKRVADPMEAEDLQPAHSEAMTYVAARVTSLATEGQFDESLKETAW